MDTLESLRIENDSLIEYIKKLECKVSLQSNQELVNANLLVQIEKLTSMDIENKALMRTYKMMYEKKSERVESLLGAKVDLKIHCATLNEKLNKAYGIISSLERKKVKGFEKKVSDVKTVDELMTLTSEMCTLMSYCNCKEVVEKA